MKRAKHNLGYTRLASFDMGNIVPIGMQEILPGDSIRMQTSALLRVTPLVAPVMHRVNVQIHSWFVPNRILWSNWDSFITDPDSGLTVPEITLDTASTAGCLALADAMGIGHNIVPAVSGTSRSVIALPFRAYNKIWNEFYRDKDIDTALTEDVSDTDTDANYTLKRARWKKDFFSVARTTAQHGAEEQAAVGGGGTTLDISEWRRAMSMQKLRERLSHFGSTYRDRLAFLGIKSSDARLDRPEYLGGGKQYISFSEVLATNDDGGTNVTLGQMGGHGIAAVRTRPFKRFFEEHGWMLTFLIARPDPVYQQVMPPEFKRNSWEDYFQPELMMLGDEQILNMQVWYGHTNGAQVFGYIPRFDNYRRRISTVSGDFRTTLGTLDHWHMARAFSSNPSLNSTFLECTPTDRIYVATSPHELMGMVRHRVAAKRLVPKRARI